MPATIGEFEELISGPQTFQYLLENEIAKAKQVGYESGYRDANTEIESRIKKRIETYISSVIKVGALAHSLAAKLNVKITHFFVNFCFDTGAIDTMFVIDSPVEDEILFSQVLDEAEQKILKEDKFIAEALFVNKRNKDIDFATLKNNYPFSFNPSIFDSSK